VAHDHAAGVQGRDFGLSAVGVVIASQETEVQDAVGGKLDDTVEVLQGGDHSEVRRTAGQAGVGIVVQGSSALDVDRVRRVYCAVSEYAVLVDMARGWGEVGRCRLYVEAVGTWVEPEVEFDRVGAGWELGAAVG
jgi:hypothetical protein